MSVHVDAKRGVGTVEYEFSLTKISIRFGENIQHECPTTYESQNTSLSQLTMQANDAFPERHSKCMKRATKNENKKTINNVRINK